MTHYDVVIVGGAIVGSSTAYFLRKNGFAGSIAVIEKDPSYARAATPLSWGGVRRQFSTPANILLSSFGYSIISDVKKEFGPDADISFRETGYLVLGSSASIPVLEENAKLQRAMGAHTELYGPAELAKKFPHGNFEGIAMASFAPKGEGWFDPWGLMNLVRKGAIARGTDYLADEVVGIDAGTRVTGVTLKSGQKISTNHLVNAAGPAAGAVAAMVGFDLPVSPAKRFTYIVDCPAAPEALRMGPAWFNIDGVYWRPEGRNFMFGFTPSAEEEPAVKDWEMEHHWFEDKIWPSAFERVPAFESLKVISGYVGHYDYNWFDQNGIIGRHPGLSNFYFGNGFSGHGIQQGPATGNAIAELIMFGAFKTLDVSALNVVRIAANKPVFEKNIF
ncbi:MAG: FAD-binding oxidoreductase [Hyphomicrobiales bacterium]